MDKIYVVTIGEELEKSRVKSHVRKRDKMLVVPTKVHPDDITKAQVKPYIRTRRGKMERVKGYDIPTRHMIRIAMKTLTMPDAMVGVMGGPTKEEARATLARFGIKTRKGKGGEW